ncbi:hypothetical protein [Mycolicibacter longobardus]|uniref:Uncharacterized protein n=1 Tax=Mycolicibacter longobardus TaxID=1108812 RepID=A0A1X1YDV1_9MYCO|nr:hypothetical protein [Mycolicibacter longobardus]MCV7382401.1 hypothetical protein [Mycolicibacter longobardus]ORW09224.1 hypothetical protein AWC16_17800 [Mycolicibacter longobardus]
MPDDPPLRRSVRDFCKHYGLSRNQFLAARSKAKVRAKDWGTLLSANDEKALLEHVSADRRSEQVIRSIREQPRVTKRLTLPPKPPVDYAAEFERMSRAFDQWRHVLGELAKGHVPDERTGRCKRCHEEAPCRTRRTLNRIDNELVEQVAVADSGDPGDGFDAANQPAEVQPERSLSELYEARNRCRRALVELTIDHMIVDDKGHCTQCPKGTPCDINNAITRINRGIAKQIETYACMSDGEREAALGERPMRYYYDEGDDDWDAV